MLCGLGEEAEGRDAIPAPCPNPSNQYSGGLVQQLKKGVLALPHEIGGPPTPWSESGGPGRHVANPGNP